MLCQSGSHDASLYVSIPAKRAAGMLNDEITGSLAPIALFLCAMPAGFERHLNQGYIRIAVFHGSPSSR